MKTRKKPTLAIIIILFVILLAMGSTSIYFVLRENPSETDAFASSLFSFTGASDGSAWWRGGAESPNTTDITLHAGTDIDSLQPCFVSAAYNTGTIDAAAELQKQYDLDASIGDVVTPISTQTLSMRTTAEPVQYELYQSAVTTATGGASLRMGGRAFGWIRLTEGYIAIKSYCMAPAKLPTIIPVLEAIRFNEAG